MNKQALELSFKVTERWIEYWQLQISSGAYKNQRVTRGDGHVLTEPELLDDAFGTLHNHMHILSEITENLKGILTGGSNGS